MSNVYAEFLYEVKDIHGTIRQTQSLLRFVNNLRQTFNDINDLMKAPTIGKYFWTLIQILRTYQSLRRLLKLLQAASGKAAVLGGIGEVAGVISGAEPAIPGAPPIGFAPMQISVEAFRDNVPIRVESIDLSMLPEQTRAQLQSLFNEDAETTVLDARAILNERVSNYVSKNADYMYTGNRTLENSIRHERTSNGYRVVADAYYAWWVEQGHQSFSGHWFMGDAAEMAKVRLPMRVREALRELMAA